MAKNLLLWLVIAAVLLSIFNNFSMQSPTERMVYSEFIQEIQRDQVRKVTIDGLTIYGERLDGSRFETTRPMLEDPKLIDDLLSHSVEVEGREPEQQSVWTQLLVASFPILIIIAVFMFFMRQMQGGAGGRGGPMSFGKSKARLLGEDQITTTFADVAGVDEAKEDVQELVEFLRDPSKFQKLGGRIPRGVLMVGPAGHGQDPARQGDRRRGEGAVLLHLRFRLRRDVRRCRRLARARHVRPGEEAVTVHHLHRRDRCRGPHRGAGLGGGHDEREQTLNQLLVEMDGFEANDGVIVIAATNRPDVLDPALLRPGRFDRQVVVGLPDIRGREQILKVHMRKVPLSEDVDASKIARGTPGFSGADLANLVNEAALFAARAGSRMVGMTQFELAKDKIMMGAERRSMVMSETKSAIPPTTRRDTRSSVA
jgi:cell division protease FtsH